MVPSTEAPPVNLDPVRLTDEQIARVCHEANRAYCLAVTGEWHHPWDQAPRWQKDSAIAGVTTHRMDRTLSPAESHAAWMKHKQADGWKYGPVKDEAKKEHPCMVPYDQLPPAQRVKDALFIAIIDALA